MFHEFDKQWINPYEEQARDALFRYLIVRKNHPVRLGFMAERRVNHALTREELIKRIASHEVIPISRVSETKTRCKKIISMIVEKKRRERKLWKTTFELAQARFKAVDLAVKEQVRDCATEEYESLHRLHQHIMRWLDMCERVIRVYEKNITELSENMDLVGNQNARLAQMLIRAVGIGLLTPLFMGGFLDPAIEVVDKIVQTILLRKGVVDLNLDQSHVYHMTGLLPDANKTTYIDAYRKLKSETIYQSFQRYRHCLNHKIGTLSKTRELADLMADHSTLWNGYTPDQIIRALRIHVIEKSHFQNPGEETIIPEKASNLISHTAEPLKAIVKKLFEPIKSQYGDKKKLEGIHALLDKIEFDSDRAGTEAHNGQRENAFVLSQSNHMEIHLIVKFLVEETKYFGGTSAFRPLMNGRRDIRPDDNQFGLEPDSEVIRELIMAMIKRIMRTDNDRLKKILDLDPLQTEEDQIKNCLLVGWTGLSTFNFNVKHYTNLAVHKTGIVGKYQPIKPEGDHQRRRKMIWAILREYYETDIGDLLQRKTIDFAHFHGIDFARPEHAPDKDGIFIAPKWASEDELKSEIDTQTKPFVQQATQLKKMCLFYHDLGNVYRNKKLLVADVQKEIGLEKIEHEHEQKRKKHELKDL
jgi:hypothetical protein